MSDEQAIAAVDNILEDRTKTAMEPEKVENDMPNSYELTQLKAINDNPSEMESFQMEDSEIPLNMRLLQTKDDDEETPLYDNEGVPFNQKLLYLKSNEDDADTPLYDGEGIPRNFEFL